MNHQSNFPTEFKPLHIRAATQEDFLFDQPGAFGAGTQGDVAELFIVGEIGGWWGIFGADIYSALQGRKLSKIKVYLSSGGGGIFEAFQIHDMLRGHPAPVEIYIFSLAASSATTISAAGNRVIMSKQALFMVHEGANYLRGYYGIADMESNLNLLKKLHNRYIDLQQRRTGLSPEQLAEIMALTTWFEPQEAVDAGFVDEVVDFIEIPFENAALSHSLWSDVFFDHSANGMRQRLEPQGFQRLAASALNSLTAKPRPTASHSTISSMNFGQQILQFFKGKNWQITTNGAAVSDETATQELNTAATQEGGSLVPVLGEQLENRIGEIVAQVIAAQPAPEPHADTLAAIQALQTQFGSLNDHVSQLQQIAPQTQEAAATTQQQVQEQESQMQQLTQQILNMQVARAGGQRFGDVANQQLQPPAAESPAVAFGPNSALYNTLVATQQVNPALISSIEARVRQKRAEMGK